MLMHCNTCKLLVQANSIGVCLGCQRGFSGKPQEDAYINRGEEEYADEKCSSKTLPTQKQTRDGKKMGKGNTKRKITREDTEETQAITEVVDRNAVNSFLFKRGYFAAVINLREIYQDSSIPTTDIFYEMVKWGEGVEKRNCDRIEWRKSEELLEDIYDHEGKSARLSIL